MTSSYRSTAPTAKKEASVMMEKGRVTSGMTRTGLEEKGVKGFLLQWGPDPWLVLAG